ncbi:E3 ubiquitin-protein ligase AIRP2-like [Diospyros lotus]|uniref:E3 ubiquitin-protein ligase AIRP2-like n=1 Tax=Diospyros lotus TaxID=55363 RepID=UPI00224C975E|nr:E3 ubiquitin-protein ligase AIRP2-like [Diospyros lotus]
MRLSRNPATDPFLFLVLWAGCHLAVASSLGLIGVFINMTAADGRTPMSMCERKASIKEFYTFILPSLKQLEAGKKCLEDEKQKAEIKGKKCRKSDFGREEECAICMQMSNKIVLPNCCHSLCLKCYRAWNKQSRSCPFCRDELKQVKSSDLWICVGNNDIVDPSIILRDNLRRLFCYIEKLPLSILDPIMLQPYNFHPQCLGPLISMGQGSPDKGSLELQ